MSFKRSVKYITELEFLTYLTRPERLLVRNIILASYTVGLLIMLASVAYLLYVMSGSFIG